MKSKKVVVPRRSFLQFNQSAIKYLVLSGLALVLVGLPILTSGQSALPTKDLKQTRKQAEQMMKRGEFAQAEILWLEILNHDAKDNYARLNLSFALLKQRKLEDAYLEAKKIADKFGNRPVGFVACERELQTDGIGSDRRDRIVGDQDCRQFQNVHRNAARAHALIGSALLGVGAFPRALNSFRTALNFNPDDSLATAGLGLIDFYENRTTESLRKLRKAAFLSPNEPDFVFALAQVASRTENYKEAADAYTKFLRIAPISDVDRRSRIQGLIDFLRYLGTQKSIYDIGGAKSSKVNFEIINNRPIIKVRINDEAEEMRFVLDTGSGMSVISEETARRLNLKPIARGGNARAVGGGGKFEIVYAFISSLSIGEARISNVPVYVRKFYATGEGIDGYIGLSVISKFLTTVDYGNKTFSITRQGKNDKNRPSENHETDDDSADALQQIPLRLTSSGFLSGEVKIEGVQNPLNFIIDTGASISVVSEEAALNEEIRRHAQEATMRVFGAAGVTENVASLLLPKVSLGKSSREKIQAAVLDLKPINETAGYEQAGILGGNFLRHYRVTFDFQSALVWFEPTQATKEADAKTLNIKTLPNNQE